MHRLYLEKWEPAAFKSLYIEAKDSGSDEEENKDETDLIKPQVTYQRYLDHFAKSGLRIGLLKVDTCALCDKLKEQISAASGQEKADLEEQRDAHLGLADVSYKMRTYDQQKALKDKVDRTALPLPFRSLKGVETICSDFMVSYSHTHTQHVLKNRIYPITGKCSDPQAFGWGVILQTKAAFVQLWHLYCILGSAPDDFLVL